MLSLHTTSRRSASQSTGTEALPSNPPLRMAYTSRSLRLP
uniref:Uncharacterized protein n=1 Tax=Arundo donax TaxID=35708 RepID=A0A0A9FBK4_ARUDO